MCSDHCGPQPISQIFPIWTYFCTHQCSVFSFYRACFQSVGTEELEFGDGPAITTIHGWMIPLIMLGNLILCSCFTIFNKGGQAAHQ